MITPKGRYSKMAPSLDTYKPFLLLGLISTSAVFYATIAYGNQALAGQVAFALSNATLMLSICLVDIDLRLRQTKTKLHKLTAGWFKPVLATSLLSLFVAGTFITSPLISEQLVTAVTKPAKVSIDEPIIPISKMNTEQLTEQLKLLRGDSPSMLPTIGIYNEKPVTRTSSKPYIRHTFSGWDNDQYLAQQLLISFRSHNVPLVTIEPQRDVDGVELLTNIANGAYDDRLLRLSDIFSANDQPVYIRFAHEMDLANLYSWGAQDPSLYISAYRYVVGYMRSHGATNVKWVWSPAGNNGAEDYYPGDDVVDVVGTTVLHDQYWYGNYQPSFYELAQKRIWLNQYEKPVWIVEFGVGTADDVFQRELIDEALAQYKDMGFDSLLYLNMKDANISGPDYTLHSLEHFDTIFSKPTIALPAQTQTVQPKISKPAKINSCDDKFWSQTSSPMDSLFIVSQNPKVICSDR